MKIKLNQKHEYSNQGFTILELLVAMVVALLAMGAIYSTFLTQHKSYVIQEETAAMHQNIRAAMFYMQREIRMAGCDPIGTSGAGITTANATSIRFSEDVRGDVVGSDSDGATDDDNEDITYARSGSDLVRNTNLGGGDQIVAENIDAIDFVYLDATSNVLNDYSGTTVPIGAVPAANINQIRSVEVTIVARTGSNTLASPTNRAYFNQRGRQIFQAPGDNFSRRRLTAWVKCRNLGI